MRKLSSDYKVYYMYSNKDFLKGAVCFSGLFNMVKDHVTEDKILKIKNIKCEETVQYLREYTKRLAKILNLTYKLDISEDTLEIKGFTNLLSLKIFVTLYRILWEICGVGKDPNIEFLKLFTTPCKQRKQLISQLCIAYNDSKIWQGGGHGIARGANSETRKNVYVFKSKKEFHERILQISKSHCQVIDTFNI